MVEFIHVEPGPLGSDLLAKLESRRLILLEPEKTLVSRLVDAGLEFEVSAHAHDGDLVIVPRRPLDELTHIVDRLLGPGGCPWDQAQTHESLKKHLIEEAYEVIDAIDDQDTERLREELGDLLLQPFMHAQIRRERTGEFDIDDVARGIVEKLVRRHPHVFGDANVADADEVLKNWDRIKQGEKGSGSTPKSILAGVPRSMPALLRAHEVSKRAARSGFEWADVEAVFDKLREEENELRAELPLRDRERLASELGDLLFTAVNIARWLDVEPEEALQKMVDRFTTRFMAMEAMTERPLRDLSPAEWDVLWSRAKARQ